MNKVNGPVGIGILASGSGSNFESLVKANIPGGAVRLLIVNKPGVGALDRARRLGVEALVIEPKSFPDREAFYGRITDELEKRGIRLVCLAGFLLKLEPGFIRRFPGRILNIHPALLPKFGGKGLWGHHVHEAVLTAGEKESGCTVHVVDEEYDHGPILAQIRVPVLPGDTPDALAARILKEEHRLFPKAVEEFLTHIREVKP
jgi:phosphoribosylglycinamide formyltransferase-1